MWASGAKLCSSTPCAIRSIDWEENGDGGGGWLAAGGEEGTVGISWIDGRGAVRELKDVEARQIEDNLACTEESRLYKSHFHLRGHVGQIELVRWRKGGDKLASYDSWGRLIGWRSRANVLAREFQIQTSINVTDMQWSHCGYYLFVCGQDGNAQMFSGHNGLNLFSLQIQALSPMTSKAQFTTCCWNQPNTRVALGTQSGEVVLLDPSDNGQTISTMSLRQGVPVQTIRWYGPIRDCTSRSRPTYKSQSLSILMKNGDVVFFISISSQHCLCCKTGVCNGQAEWNSTHTLMAVVGYQEDLCSPVVRFLNAMGYVMYTIMEGLPQVPREKVYTHSISWALQDSVLLLAQGKDIYTVEVLHEFPSLQFLCRRAITEVVEGGGEREKQEPSLPLPRKELEALEDMSSPWIAAPLPTYGPDALEALFMPVPPNQRLLCILEQTEASSTAGYTLKYEFLNQYIPILKAKRKPRRPGKLLQAGYIIEPASSIVQQQRVEGKYWAREVLESERDGLIDFQSNRSTKQQSRSFVKWVRSAFRQPQQLSDSPSSSTPAATPTRKPLHTPLVLAEVEGNPITNCYEFNTSSPLFQDGHLGSASISTTYMKSRPRSLKVSLSLKQGDLSESGEETKTGDSDTISLQSRLPEWNDQYHIYELDFGGRVCQDSIKNLQVEKNGNIVLQFGRIHGNSFCLDFQAPFSPVQALCTALACL